MKPLITPKRIIIHGSATADSNTLSWGVIGSNASKKGAKAHPYHDGIELVRGRFECLHGRPDQFEGAHCRGGGQNHEALGFCFVGDYDIVEPTEEMLIIACQRVLVPKLITYGLTPADLKPHNEYSTKTCPGELFDMDCLRSIAAGIWEDVKWLTNPMGPHQ